MIYNILVADDYIDGISIATDLLKGSFLAGKFKLFTTNFIKEKSNCPPDTQTVVDIIEGLDHLEIAFVDLVWDEEFGRNEEGGNFIINLIREKFPTCLIIPLTNQIGKFLKKPTHSIEGGIMLDAISKDREVENQMLLFYKYLSNWQLSFLKSWKDKSLLRRLLKDLDDSMASKVSSSYEVNGQLWSFYDFVFDELQYDSEFFFSKKELKNEILELLNWYKGPQNGTNWNFRINDTYWSLYHLLKNNKPDFKKYIEENSKKYVSEIKGVIANGGSIDQVVYYNWKATNNPKRRGKFIEKDLLNKLIWRQITIRIYQSTERLSNKDRSPEEEKLYQLRSLVILLQVHNQGEYNESFNKFDKETLAKHESNARNLFTTHLGFSTISGFLVYPIPFQELFPEEEDI